MLIKLKRKALSLIEVIIYIAISSVIMLFGFKVFNYFSQSMEINRVIFSVHGQQNFQGSFYNVNVNNNTIIIKSINDEKYPLSKIESLLSNMNIKYEIVNNKIQIEIND
jgi:hypothetical protein